MGELLASEQASKVLMDCLLATLQRNLPEGILASGDPEQTVAEFCSEGRIASMLRQKKESTIRRIHTALLQVPKTK